MQVFVWRPTLRWIADQGLRAPATLDTATQICCMSFRVHFALVIFSPFSIAITSLWEERANISAFRMFVRFVLV